MYSHWKCFTKVQKFRNFTLSNTEGAFDFLNITAPSLFSVIKNAFFDAKFSSNGVFGYILLHLINIK